MAEHSSRSPVDHEVDRLYARLLTRLGLGDVTCTACARALLPAPFNWESYTYTARTGESWTWDIVCARALVYRRSRSQRLVLEPADVETWLVGHSDVDEQHLSHIPAYQIDEPVLLAPVPDGGGNVMIDGSHRATVRIRARLSVEAFLLTPIESTLAVGVVPLAMHRIAEELRRRGLLPRDFQH